MTSNSGRVEVDLTEDDVKTIITQLNEPKGVSRKTILTTLRMLPKFQNTKKLSTKLGRLLKRGFVDGKFSFYRRSLKYRIPDEHAGDRYFGFSDPRGVNKCKDRTDHLTEHQIRQRLKTLNPTVSLLNTARRKRAPALVKRPQTSSKSARETFLPSKSTQRKTARPARKIYLRTDRQPCHRGRRQNGHCRHQNKEVRRYRNLQNSARYTR